MSAPSGNQIMIVTKDQQAVVVEVGGGLRSYSVGGHKLLDGYDADEMSSSGRGQVLIPWPNRLQDGSYEFNGHRYQLPLNEPEHRNAIHGLVRWSTWTATEREPHRVVMDHILYPQPGYPFLLGISIEYALSDSGLQVRTTATNLGTQSCPYGSGAHPYLTLGTETIERFDFARTWANGPAVRQARPSDPEGSRRGNRIRFSAAETNRLGKARPRIYRPCARRGWPRSPGTPRFGPRNKSLPLGRPELPLFDALQRRSASKRSPSQPCRRAHDLPTERISNRGCSDPPGAKCLVHRYVGHCSWKRILLTVNSDSSAPLNVIPRRPDCTIQQRSSAAWKVKKEMRAPVGSRSPPGRTLDGIGTRRLLLLWHLHIDEVVADQAILTLTLADHQPVSADRLLLAVRPPRGGRPGPL